MAALRRWRQLQDSEREFFGNAYHPGDYLFTYQDGRPPHPDTIRQRFDRLAAAAGLSRITFHDLRHSYATGALRAGIGPKVISERIGHAMSGSSWRRTPTCWGTTTARRRSRPPNFCLATRGRTAKIVRVEAPPASKTLTTIQRFRGRRKTSTAKYLGLYNLVDDRDWRGR